MKRNIISGIILIGALALGSCSTTKLASNQLNQDDDVYYSNAKAGDQPDYIANAPQQDTYNTNPDDDYYYYDSYASRINRFNYLSPFGYYDDFYDGFNSPYYGGYNGFSLGFNYGFGDYYGYSPFYSSLYSPYGYYGGFGYGYGYSPYSYWGTGYGNGFWGVYSASRNNNPRPYRGSGAPNSGFVNRTARPIGYNGNYPVNNNYPGRPNINYNGRQSNGAVSNARPTRAQPQQQQQPNYQPQPRVQSAPAPAPSNSGNGGGGYSGGGGGARPTRP